MTALILLGAVTLTGLVIVAAHRWTHSVAAFWATAAATAALWIVAVPAALEQVNR